jgi:hypothetical protein
MQAGYYQTNLTNFMKYKSFKRRRREKSTSSKLAFNPNDLEIFRSAEKEFKVVIYPSSVQLIKYLINRGIGNGVIETEEEKDLVITTITVASIDYVKKHGKNYVRPNDVIGSWKKDISMGPGNCPPHRCMRKSILSTMDEIFESFPHIEKLITSKK